MYFQLKKPVLLYTVLQKFAADTELFYKKVKWNQIQHALFIQSIPKHKVFVLLVKAKTARDKDLQAW